MKKIHFVLVLILSMFLIQSCQKDAEIDPYAGQEAPQLPPEATFIMSTEPFTEMDELTGSEIEDRSLTNWGHSAGNVLVWNTLLTIHLAIPTLSFYESFNHDPEYQGQGVWLWDYEVTDQTGTYQAELYGELLVNNEVKWDMYVSKDGGWSDVHWYSGIVALDHTYANWTLNHNPHNPTPLISIAYQKDNGNGVASIRYTNIIPSAPGNSGYIEYRTGNVVPGVYNRGYDVFNAEIDNLLEINWDEASHNGRVKDPDFFGDSEWHCWGTDLLDTDC